MAYRYYLRVSWDDEWKEVSKENWIKAERNAGFRPKLPSYHPDYMSTCATGGFGTSRGIYGRIEYDIKEPT